MCYDSQWYNLRRRLGAEKGTLHVEWTTLIMNSELIINTKSLVKDILLYFIIILLTFLNKPTPESGH